MKTLLIVNTRERACAIHQYGLNLYWVLNQSKNIKPLYVEPRDVLDLKQGVAWMKPDAILYNWHPTQGGFLKDAPFNVDRPVKNLCVFHELDFATEKFDAVLYSAMATHPPTEIYGQENWYPIPLLIPIPESLPSLAPVRLDCPVIGVSGFGGAFADQVVERAFKEFEKVIVRLHLPFAIYGDKEGVMAKNMANKCVGLMPIPGTQDVTINHDFFVQDHLLSWMARNDINVFIRPTETPWTGVSASMCAALAAKRPIAISRSQCFRHLWDVNPSILVEDRSLKEILESGTAPLQPVYEANSTAKFVARIEEILGYLGL